MAAACTQDKQPLEFCAGSNSNPFCLLDVWEATEFPQQVAQADKQLIPFPWCSHNQLGLMTRQVLMREANLCRSQIVITTLGQADCKADCKADRKAHNNGPWTLQGAVYMSEVYSYVKTDCGC